jgi:hypothetical protein
MDKKEKLFLELIEGFEWKCDIKKYPNFLFGFKDDICLFEIHNHSGLNQNKIIANYRFVLEQDLKNADFWFDYDKIWSVFESKFGMNYNEIKSFMNGMVEKHFKMKGFTTCIVNSCKCFGWKNISK